MILTLLQAISQYDQVASEAAAARIQVAPTFTSDLIAGSCLTDRPDPYVCECLGLNGCWKPSEPGHGPPYMHSGVWPTRSKHCTVLAGGNPSGDDAPEVLNAFANCKQDSHITFEVSLHSHAFELPQACRLFLHRTLLITSQV